MANGFLYIFLLLCGFAAGGISKFVLSFLFIDKIITMTAAALANCGNWILFVRNTFHFIKHI
uniref:Uncharacterized protein n=1 Tax=Wuchereria bancrofti TaxID=6293 RepID=A0AAF5Q425_WUCBA